VSAAYCTGQTIPGATDWKQYGSYGLYLDVPMDCPALAASGAGRPVVVTSLGGTSSYNTIGATSIYSATANQFRVYLRKKTASYALSPTKANSWKWHINWKAIPE